MELAILVIAAILLFEFAAVRWGYDSRDLFRIDTFRDNFR
jgi:hypothetical protein